jgi:predicted DsbA family dithiol-disulfide isomerase
MRSASDPTAIAGMPAAAPDRTLSIVSDAICPWCYVLKRRLDRIQQRLPEVARFALSWKPYQLNPDMPREGMDRKAYRSAKFGSWEKSLALDAQVKAAAADDIEFHHERMTRTPNSFNAHRLVWWAGQRGLQDETVEAIFEGYFVLGQDIGDTETLAKLAARAGLDRDQALAFLTSDEGAAEVRAEELAAGALGVRSVPTVRFGEQTLFSGAPQAGDLERLLIRLNGQ